MKRIIRRVALLAVCFICLLCVGCDSTTKLISELDVLRDRAISLGYTCADKGLTIDECLALCDDNKKDT